MSNVALFVIAEVATWQIYVVPGFLGLVSLILLFAAGRALWRKRLIQNIPRSKVQGITIGLNELSGEAVSRVPMNSYLTKTNCVYYEYTIEEEYEKTERYKDKNGKWKERKKKEWRTIRSGGNAPRFTLRDETGTVRVDPEKAEIDAEQVLSKVVKPRDPLWRLGPHRQINNSTGRRRFREAVIPNGAKVYLLGTARLREDIVAPEIAHEPTSEIFLISVREKKKVISGYAWKSRITFFFSFLFAVLTPLLALLLAGVEPEAVLSRGALFMVLAGALTLLIYAGIYMKTIYNGLIDVRNRARRAWSMIEVELKRRHDLIPNLVNLVQAQANHELDTLASVTRARAAVNVPSNPGAAAVKKVDEIISEQTALYQNIFAVVEDYPTIKSDRGFERLMKELTLCEDRIALARSFYNDSVERLNTRVESFPDLIFASVAKTTPRLMIGASEFEQKPVTVKLVEDQEPIPEEPGPEEAEEIEEGSKG